MVEERVHPAGSLPHIGADFNAATLKRLVEDFKGLSPEAASTVAAFQSAAEKVREQSRPRAENARLSVLSRLRSTEHMTALRAFEKAKEALLDVDSGGLGLQIAVETERSFLDKKR